ncbi:restriction endonuclease subunit S [Bacillus pumilus]|uniref:restriction endonuclease subunit S n=1 Tax=Bacillus pumilus TaxID=1408 RepID=UPI001C92C8A6|nr:restriction endonuclease subunit S [Bacillus pumilus]
MEQTNLVPKRRFKEFQNSQAWEQSELSELAKFTKGSGYTKLDLREAGSPIILYGRLYTDYETVIEVVDTFVDRMENSVISLGGEVVVPSSGESAEDIARASVVGKTGIVLGGDLNIIKPNERIDPVFLALAISNGAPNRDMVKRAQGKSVVHLHNSDLKKINLVFPQIDEQRNIAEFNLKIDRLITLHQRKLEKAKALKSAYLTEMFPAEGEREPKRRFAGFTQAWEQRKVGELADIVRGASPRPIQDQKWFDDESDIGWLRIADVTEQDGRIQYLEQRISKAGQEKTRVLTEPHLLLSIAATVGKPVVNYVKTGVHDGFLIFQNPKFDREFMFQWLEMFRPKWQKYGQPGSQVNLNSDLVKNQEIMLPNEEEQKKIGDFFAQLDHLITLHKRKLEKLQNLKKAYLNEMFV